MKKEWKCCILTASLVTYFPWASLVAFVTCCPNFSLPLFDRKTSAFSYLSKNSFILLFRSATQRVLERRVPFRFSADYHRKKSFSVLCSFDRGLFIHLRTLENWPNLFTFFLLLAFGFFFFSVFFFLFLIKVKFWYRTGCWPAANIYE